MTFPTTNSLGCALTNRFPTSCTRCINLDASIDLPGSALAFATTRRKRYAVAIAQGRELCICRLLRSLDHQSLVGGSRLGVVGWTHEMNCSIEVSSGSDDMDRRKAVSPGAVTAVAVESGAI